MSRILLDTSAYSAYTGGHPDLQEPVRHASTVHLSLDRHFLQIPQVIVDFFEPARPER